MFFRRRALYGALMGSIVAVSFAVTDTASKAATPAPVDPGTLAAEQAPLAIRSLLLDIARAGSRFVAVGERGHVLLSDNRGQTWTQAQTVPTQELLTAVCFSDDLHGVAVGHDEVALVTTDGGNTWQRTHYAPEARQPLLDVLCNGSDAIAVGAYGTYLESADRGVTWTGRKFEASAAAEPTARAASATPTKATEPATDDPDADDAIGGDPHLNRIVGASGSRLYIAAEAGHLYRSDDAGKTWSELPSPYDGSFFGLLPLDGGALLAYGLRGHLYRSEDGGHTWQPIAVGTEAMLNDAIRLPSNGIALVGLSGAVLLSTDNGKTFTLKQQDDRKGLAALLSVGVSELVTVGEAGVKAIPVEAKK